MKEKPLIDEKEIEIGSKTFLISKIPSIAAREILLSYSPNKDGKLEADSASTILKLLFYCSVKIGDTFQRLTTEDFIDAHVSTVFDLMKLEGEMVSYNFGFFGLGEVSASSNS